MRLEASHGRLPVVRIDLQRRMHPHGKPLLRRVVRFPRAVAPRVSDHFDSVPEAVHGVSDEHDVFVPTHKVALPRGPPHDEALCPALDLAVNHSVICLEVEAAVREVRGFDGGDEAQLLDLGDPCPAEEPRKEGMEK